MLDNEPTGGDQTATQPTGDAGEAGSTPARRVHATRRRTTKAAPAGGEITENAPTREDADGSAVQAAAAQEPAPGSDQGSTRARRTRRTSRTSETGVSAQEATEGTEGADGVPQPAPRTRRRKATAPPAGEQPDASGPAQSAGGDGSTDAPPRTRSRARGHDDTGPAGTPAPGAEPAERPERATRRRAPAAATVLFMAPEVPAERTESRRASTRAESRSDAPAEPLAADSRTGEPAAEADEQAEASRSRSRRRGRRASEQAEAAAGTRAGEISAADAGVAAPEDVEEPDSDDENDDEYEVVGGRRRRRRGRRGRGRGRGTAGEDAAEGEEAEAAAGAEDEEAEPDEAEAEEPLTRRRRRRRRGSAGNEATETAEDGVVTVVKVRQPRAARDEVQGVSGSTRLEAKRQRRRDGREQRRTRPPILSESEFLARREAVDRAMVVREKGDRTQIAVLEDGVLVEHYVTRASAGSMVGNVYLGKVQNVLPSMEAAFVDIGRGRNAVLYAGEVNWDASGLEGRARSIEQALKSGDSVLVQVTKDPIGHKGARLTSHIALSGRHLVYVPHGNASGISRKLPDNERRRLRDVLKNLIPDGAGVIVRTAAEGASADELERDVTRLQAQWSDIQAKSAEGGAPVLLYEEPDLVIRVVRDLFNEDFRDLLVQGSDAYEMVEMYLKHVSPDLVPRLHRYTGNTDAFAERRIDEQILKGLDRKVYLPSGGSLVIDRTEAMTVIDVNTGKYTGTGGNLEETVTRNNLEAAEEIVRQLRLRDLGGIIVIDFIDMVLESNRDLVLRRLTECLGRDRTKHQVTEITSLGLVQMTRKRIGQGLLEAFSETCEHCKGRGLIIHTEPVSDRRQQPARTAQEPAPAPSGRRRGRKAAAALAAGAEVEPREDQERAGATESGRADGVTGSRRSRRQRGWDAVVAAASLTESEDGDEVALAAGDVPDDGDLVAVGGRSADDDDLVDEPDDLEGDVEGLADEDEEDEDSEDDSEDEDLLDTIEEDVAEERGEGGETDFEPIDAVGTADNGRFRASADDPDAIDNGSNGVPGASFETGAAVVGGRRRVIWSSRRRTRP